MDRARDRPGGIIHGSGPRHPKTHEPLQCDGMLIGEAGGENEHRLGRPFVGKTGIVMDAYLKAASVARADLWIDNIYPYWPGPGNPDPTTEQIKSAESKLYHTLAAVKPRVIGSVGRISSRWFLGDVDMDTCHGVPSYSPKVEGAVVVPIYHPASGFYNPDLAAYSQNDFLMFGLALRNPIPARPTPKITVVYHDEAPEWIENAAVDTEGLEDKPWGMSWAYFDKPNEAHVWCCGQGKRPPKLRGRIRFHNALHDLKILRAMGIDTRRLDFDDTMVMAFDLQLEPQALKSLSYRHLNFKMTEFDETVREHFDKLALAWLTEAARHVYPKPAPRPVEDYSKRKWRIYKPWDTGRRIKSIVKSYEKNRGIVLDDPTKEPTKLEKKWAELSDSFKLQAEAAVGRPFPEFSIFCVPHDKAVNYSGTDAAATELVKGQLAARIQDQGLSEVYEMDRRALPFVDRMQEVGLRVDLGELRRVEVDLQESRGKCRRKVQRIVGDRWFNPGSGDQVARWLYEVRGLPVDSRTQTESGRGGTSDSVLQMLRGFYGSGDDELCEFITSIQDYRECDKLLGTFVEPIFQLAVQDPFGNWRIHPNFRVTRVVSGRLSAFNPNILAIPTRGENGKRIRACFRAGDGYVILSADMSQIELRTGAHYTRDRRMVSAFEAGEDLHMLTAIEIFKLKVPAEGITRAFKEKYYKERYVAKCFHPDTEVLSRTRGWVKIPDIKPGEEIAQAWPQDGGTVRLSWTVPTEVYTTRHPSESLIHFKSEGIDLSVTPDHRMLYFDSGGRVGVALARDLPIQGVLVGAGTLPDHGVRARGNLPALNIVRLAVATQADGCYSGHISKMIRFGFVKQRKINRMRELLERVDPTGKEWRESIRKDQRVVEFFVYRKLSEKIRACLDPDKTLSWRMLDYTPEMRSAILEEARYWDSANRGSSYTYSSVVEKNNDVLQAIAAITDMASRKSGNTLSVKEKTTSYLRGVSREETTYTGEVACLSVPSSFVLVRSGGIPVISGQTINFAVFYGISAVALLMQLYKAGIFDYDEDQCQQFIDQWFRIYGSVRGFQERLWKQAASDGFVRDMWGRICYVPNLRVMDDKLRESAQRLCGNFPIQSTASGVVKRAQIRLHDYIEAEGLRDDVRPWLQMHDELDIEVKEEMAEEMKGLVVGFMQADQDRFVVPIKADAGIGDSWGSAKEAA